jgi:hypothetical protein
VKYIKLAWSILYHEEIKLGKLKGHQEYATKHMVWGNGDNTRPICLLICNFKDKDVLEGGIRD